MDKLKAAARTSEFYAAIVLSLLAVGVQFGIISQATVDTLKPFIDTAASYIVLRLTGKVAKAMVKP